MVDVPPGQPTLRLDPGQIRQAFLNLIRNAAEAMPEGGTVTITAGQIDHTESRRAEGQASRGAIEIHITDTGPGIPAENLDRIFEPFFTNKEGGTGLGLAIARQIAVDHGGSLVCESTQGVGTTFRLIIPIPDGERLP